MADTIRITIDDSKLQKLIAKTRGKSPVRIVADGVEYGIHQEFGTIYMPGQPFMRPAVEKVRPGFIKALDGCVTLEQAEAVTEKAARDVERFAKINAAVDTDAMRSSIHVVGGATYEFEVMT